MDDKDISREEANRIRYGEFAYKALQPWQFDALYDGLEVGIKPVYRKNAHGAYGAFVVAEKDERGNPIQDIYGHLKLRSVEWYPLTHASSKGIYSERATTDRKNAYALWKQYPGIARPSLQRETMPLRDFQPMIQPPKKEELAKAYNNLSVEQAETLSEEVVSDMALAAQEEAEDRVLVQSETKQVVPVVEPVKQDDASGSVSVKFDEDFDPYDLDDLDVTADAPSDYAALKKDVKANKVSRDGYADIIVGESEGDTDEFGQS